MLFDQQLIAFDEAGKMLISAALSARERLVMGVDERQRLRALPEGARAFLARHRQRCLEQWALEENRATEAVRST